MILSRAPSHPALAPFIEALWVHEGELPHRYERLLPSGRMQLLVNLRDDELCDYTLEGRLANRTRGVGLQGVRTGPVIIDTDHQRHTCGVSFAVCGAWPFLGVPASEICGRVIDLLELWGRDGELLRQRLIEAPSPAAKLSVLETVLLERLVLRAPGFAGLQVACGLLEKGANVRSVCEHLGLTPRRLITLFRAHVGVSPKQFARLARFRAVLSAMDGRTPWAQLAGANGFSDQAHLIREFRAFGGTTPTAYRARSEVAIHHVPLGARQFSSILR